MRLDRRWEALSVDNMSKRPEFSETSTVVVAGFEVIPNLDEGLGEGLTILSGRTPFGSLDFVASSQLDELVVARVYCRTGECRFFVLVHTGLGPVTPICVRLGMKNTFSFDIGAKTPLCVQEDILRVAPVHINSRICISP